MTIRANIEARIVQMQAELDANPVIGGEISKKVKDGAINAVLGGATELISYMSLFANTPAELARLVPTDGTENNADMREARAYLVSNAICAPGTATTLIDNVFDRLDNPPV